MVSKIFRVILVASTAIFCVYYWMPLFDEPFYSEDARNVLALDGFGATVTVGTTFVSALFLVVLAIRSSMYLFVRWARTAFAALCLIYPFFNLFLGFRVVTPVEMIMIHFVTVADGALLAMAYFSSVSNSFRAELSRPPMS